MVTQLFPIRDRFGVARRLSCQTSFGFAITLWVPHGLGLALVFVFERGQGESKGVREERARVLKREGEIGVGLDCGKLARLYLVVEPLLLRGEQLFLHYWTCSAAIRINIEYLPCHRSLFF